MAVASAVGAPSEGTSALDSLAFDYSHHSLNQAAFKDAAERVLALRATLGP